MGLHYSAPRNRRASNGCVRSQITRFLSTASTLWRAVPKLLADTRISATVLILLALVLILSGIGVLLRGIPFYANYWGGPVFAPFAIAVGVILVFLALFRWRRMQERPPILRGKAARLARKAEETRFPIDDFDKPWNP